MKGIGDILFLRRLVRNNGIELIHTALDRADYLGILAAKTTGIPSVTTMNVKRYHPGYRFARRVVTVSRQQRELLISKGVNAAKIDVVRPGIDLERFSRPDPEKREAWRKKLGHDRFSLVFCHIANVLPQKNHSVSLDLVRYCKQKGEKPLLIIAGDPLQGEYYESLVKMIAAGGLEHNVYFTGWTSELPELLSLSHFTLLPSVHEALGMVLIEGMAAGTPIIARKGEGGAELIDGARDRFSVYRR